MKISLLPKKVKTLATIQSAFSTAIEDLKALRARNNDAVLHINGVMDELDAERDELLEENQQAEKFQTNLENLLK